MSICNHFIKLSIIVTKLRLVNVRKYNLCIKQNVTSQISDNTKDPCQAKVYYT